jgi:hypothetical protein
MRNLFVLLLLAVSLLGTTPASAQELSTLIDWQQKWGGLDLNGDDDPIIPASRHNAKSDIKNSVIACPHASDLSKLKAYEIDLDSDGKKDIFVDPSPYFGGYPQGGCPVHICDEKGCNTPIYHNDGDTQILEEKPAHHQGQPPVASCPATAALNDDCLAYCSATVQQCPALFNHVRTVKFSGRIFGWSFVSPNTFMAFRETQKVGGQYLYRSALNGNPVFRAQRDDDYCTVTEMDVNHDGTIAANEKCIKYLQWTTDASMCTGNVDACFIDLFSPPPLDTSAGSNDPLYIDSALDGAGKAINFFNRNGVAQSARGATMGEGVGFKLSASHGISAQLPTFTGSSGGAAFMCNEYINRSNKDVFIPALTDKEYASFIDAAARGQIPDVTVRACERRFTQWLGTTSCSQVAPACNEVITIAAHRDCIRSTSALGACSECAQLADTAPLGGRSNTCDYSQQCDGGACPEVHNFCLAADTKILMADGTEKDILAVKVGDLVKAFDSKDATKALIDAKVKSVLVTADKGTIALNDLKITDVHKVILEGGKRVEAKDVKIGDKIIDKDGKVIVVEKITKNLTPITVYNLDVEGADGYIAGGLRVMDYPVK